jgi:hypothetical protein
METYDWRSVWNAHLSARDAAPLTLTPGTWDLLPLTIHTVVDRRQRVVHKSM